MSIVLNPITLPASKMLATMTALIGEVRFIDSLHPTELVDELVDGARIGTVEYGKGIVHTFKVAPQPVKDLTETSSAFTITKPNVAQETIEIDNYKFVPISLSDVLSRDAVLSGELVGGFMEFALALMEDTSRFNLYDVINNLYQSWTPGQATQTVKVPQRPTDGLTGADLNAAEEWNAKQVAKVARKTLNNMRVLNTGFTDVATYTDANTGETGNVQSSISRNQVKMVFNDKYYTDFLADAMASLYHSERVGEMIPAENYNLIPESKMSAANAKTIGWLHMRGKFAFADFYRLTLSILDPSTTYRNYFYHFAYGAGVFKYMPGVKFVAEEVAPTPAS